METLRAADAEDGLECSEQTVGGEEDCVWVSVPETAGTEDENRVLEEEEYIGLPSGEDTDQEEEEDEMGEVHQILCEGSEGNICSLPWIMKNITVCLCRADAT